MIDSLALQATGNVTQQLSSQVATAHSPGGINSARWECSYLEILTSFLYNGKIWCRPSVLVLMLEPCVKNEAQLSLPDFNQTNSQLFQHSLISSAELTTKHLLIVGILQPISTFVPIRAVYFDPSVCQDEKRAAQPPSALTESPEDIYQTLCNLKSKVQSYLTAPVISL